MIFKIKIKIKIINKINLVDYLVIYHIKLIKKIIKYDLVLKKINKIKIKIIKNDYLAKKLLVYDNKNLFIKNYLFLIKIINNYKICNNNIIMIKYKINNNIHQIIIINKIII